MQFMHRIGIWSPSDGIDLSSGEHHIDDSVMKDQLRFGRLLCASILCTTDLHVPLKNEHQEFRGLLGRGRGGLCSFSGPAKGLRTAFGSVCRAQKHKIRRTNKVGMCGFFETLSARRCRRQVGTLIVSTYHVPDLGVRRLAAI